MLPLSAASSSFAALLVQAGEPVDAVIPPRESMSAFEGLLPDWVPFGMLIESLIGVLIIVSICSVLPMIFTWAERRLSGRIQQRQGPNRVGPFGLVQALADGVKLLFKEDIIPADASRFLFALAPGIVLAGTFGAFAMLPFSNSAILADTPLALFVIASLLSVEVIGVILAGWASNNKWSILGSMREAAQMISYEIPMGLCFLLAVISFGTLSLREMSLMQAGGAFNVGNWLIFHNPFFAAPAFIVFYIALLANTKRAPFDLPEAESELVSGFHTEYSGIRFSFFFLARICRDVPGFGDRGDALPGRLEHPVRAGRSARGDDLGRGARRARRPAQGLFPRVGDDLDPLDASAYPHRPGHEPLLQVSDADRARLSHRNGVLGAVRRKARELNR
jgi:NADH:ubiquinone oxidoreductase subunit H